MTQISRIHGVVFKWDSPAGTVDGSLNSAKVAVGDACHSVEGTLIIRSRVQGDKIRWEWKADIDGHSRPREGHSEEISTDIKAFVRTAMELTARYFNDTLEVRREATRALLAQKDAHLRRSVMVDRAISELAEEEEE